MYSRMVVGLDGSKLAEQILPHVEALAERFHSTLVLVQAITPPAAIMDPATAAMVGPLAGPIVDPAAIAEAEVREATAYLEPVAARLRERGFAVDYVSRAGAPAGVLLDVARELGADLLALTTHGRGGLGRLVFGSVADEVLRKAHCPVLLVRASGAEAV